MTDKLLHKTSRTYLVFALLVLTISAPLFYYITDRLYVDDADEALLLRKEEFLQYALPGLKTSEIPIWNKFNRDIKIKKAAPILNDTLFYTFYFDTLHNENEPYRELNGLVEVEGKPYTYSARINLVEAEDLMESIALLFAFIIALLMIGLYFISRKLSQRIWKPFYETLLQIEKFEIDKNSNPLSANTGIEEFNRLHLSVNRLIERNLSIYRSQREFIENAAHELQTPLAVFQAKIETFVQRTDMTAAQAEILSSLTESASRLNRLNKNLLLLSKIENESYTDKQPIFIKEAIEKLLDFFTEQANAKCIQFKTDLDGQAGMVANPVLFEILISNLFMNAIRHNTPHGSINVFLTKNRLEISNTGANRPLSDAKLFLRFSKLNPSGEGTGLGLAIVKRIANLNGWKVEYTFENNLHYFSVSF